MLLKSPKEFNKTSSERNTRVDVPNIAVLDNELLLPKNSNTKFRRDNSQTLLQ